MATQPSAEHLITEPYIDDALMPAMEHIERHRDLGIFENAATRIKEAMDKGVINPLWTADEMLQFMEEADAGTRLAFDDILALAPVETFRPVPHAEAFHALRQHYIGPDGNEHESRPKYIPLHVWPYIEALQQDSKQYMDQLKAELGIPERPGLIVESCYRSDAYQTALRILQAHLRGAGYMLAFTANPGESQHGDYDNVAIDFLDLGNQRGVREVEQFGETDAFLRTIEAGYLEQHLHRTDTRLRRPYHPNRHKPTDTADESWHCCYDLDAPKIIAKDGSETAFEEQRSALLAVEATA